ncbi:hypothetical protein DV702_13090 [Sporosarcina sp. PTS2304]|nr:hypothetical protein DV702_13090 [Sporosarcina sp. PTS2304]
MKKIWYTVFAFVCAAGVFLLSMLFQKMAYWGGGLTWYWLGVVAAYVTGGVGTVFILLTLKIAEPEKKTWLSVALVSLRAVAILAIGLGFLWTTFIVAAGMSGM